MSRAVRSPQTRRATLSRAFLAIPVVLLAGCAAGPDYERPDLSAQLGDAFAEANNASLAAQSAWWTQLEDEELTVLVERALSESIELAAARERVITARARRGIINADRLPQLDASAGYSYAESGNDAVTFAGAPPGSEVDLYATGVVAGWELDLWGRVGRLVEAADAEVTLAVEDYRAAYIALAAEVARLVIDIRAFDAEILIVENAIATDADALAVAKARSDAGFATRLDTLRAERVLRANEAILPELLAARRDAELTLATLLGQTAGSVTVGRAPAGKAALPTLAEAPASGVPADLLLRRPDVRRAERSLAATTARIGAAEAALLPRVSLSGTLELQGLDIEDAFNFDARTLQAGPSVSVPIFQGGRLRAGIAEAESRQREARFQLEQAVLAAAAEVDTAAVRLRQTREQIGRFEAAEEVAREEESLALDLYRAGATDFLSVTDATTQRLAIERSRLAAERAGLLNLVDLYTALGGSWAEAPPAETIEAVAERSN